MNDRSMFYRRMTEPEAIAAAKVADFVHELEDKPRMTFTVEERNNLAFLAWRVAKGKVGR